MTLLVCACGDDESPPAPEATADEQDSPPEPATWPALPRTDDEARELIESWTRRPPDDEPDAPVSAELLSSRLEETVSSGDAVAGWPEIRLWLRERVSAARDGIWIVFGASHDAEAQLMAFRRAFGPEGADEVTVVAEPFRADGRWAGVEADLQRGDDELLARYLSTGTDEALSALREAHAEHNYTAWKYDYLPAITDVLLQARATGQTLRSCDMPPATRELVADIDDDLRLRLRELHCVLSLGDSASGRVAVFIGDAHASASGLRRFAPSGADVLAIHAYGGRVSDHAVGRRLAERLALTDPILFPLAGDEDFALVLPDEHLRTRRERRRDRLDDPLPSAERHVLSARADPRCLLRVAAFDEPLELGDETVTVSLSTGSHAFTCNRVGDRRRIAGVLRMPDQGALEADFRATEVDLLLRE